MTNIDPAIVEALHEHRAAVHGINDERGLIAWLTICKCGARIPIAEQGPAAHQADRLAPLVAAAVDAARAEGDKQGAARVREAVEEVLRRSAYYATDRTSFVLRSADLRAALTEAAPE